MDLDQILCAPVAKKRRLADDHHEVQVPQPCHSSQASRFPAPTRELAPISVTQWPGYSTIGDMPDINAPTIQDANINAHNLASGQHEPRHTFNNWQATTIQYGSGTEKYGNGFYVGPHPQMTFPAPDPSGQYPNLAHRALSPSQLNVYQPSQAITHKSYSESYVTYPSNAQNCHNVNHDAGTSRFTGPSVSEDLECNLNCSENAQFPDAERCYSPPVEKEIVCFGMVGKS